jgi:hypothetical protein
MCVASNSEVSITRSSYAFIWLSRNALKRSQLLSWLVAGFAVQQARR